MNKSKFFLSIYFGAIALSSFFVCIPVVLADEYVGEIFNCWITQTSPYCAGGRFRYENFTSDACAQICPIAACHLGNGDRASCSFNDQIPQGKKITKIEIWARGASMEECQGIVSLHLNNKQLWSGVIDSTRWFPCESDQQLANADISGLNYNYGGENIFYLSVINGMAQFKHVYLRLHYAECTQDSDCLTEGKCENNFKTERWHKCLPNGTCNPEPEPEIRTIDADPTTTAVDPCPVEDCNVTPTHDTCGCSGYVCKTESEGLVKGCEVVDDVAVCYVRAKDCENTICCGGKLSDGSCCSNEVAYDSCIPSDKQFCQGNSIFKKVSFFPCRFADECSEVKSNKTSKVQDCGGCGPTGATRCGSFAPPQCDSPIFKQHCIDFPDDPGCDICNMPSQGIEAEYVCDSCVADGDDASCEPSSTEWKDAVNCGPAQHQEIHQGCINGLDCTFTVDFPGVCNQTLTGPVCAPPTISQICVPCDGGPGDPPDNPGPDPDPDPPSPPPPPPGCDASGSCVKGGGGGDCATSEDCPQKGCNIFKQCVLGGTGGSCKTSDDCKTLGCDASSKCVSGGTGGSCKTSDDCKTLGCNSSGQCVLGGSGADCTNSDDCKKLGCNKFNQCVLGGTGSDCKTSDDCSKLGCDSNGQCVLNGKGGGCRDSSDCEQLGCNAFGQCVLNGTGGGCRDSSDCPQLGCNSSGQCELGGTGASCDTSTDCDVSKCNEFNQCVSGGTGADCETSADCQDSVKNCNESQQCVENGTGIACDNAEDCENSSFACNLSNQCVPGGTGASCDTNVDCQNNETRCTVDGQCTIEGAGIACDNVAECKLSVAGCNSSGKCVIGGTGDDCSFDSNCEGNYSCNIYDQCVLGGGGKDCKNPEDCQISESRCTIDNKCTDSGVGMACDIDSDCENPIGRCNEYDQCVDDGTGKECKSGFDCQESGEVRCDIFGACVVNGTGIACDTSSNCNISYSCNKYDQCVPGGGGLECTDESDCQGYDTRCNSFGRCVLGGTGVACDSDEPCMYYLGGCDSSRRCVSGGGGASCLNDDDCEDISFGCNLAKRCVPMGISGNTCANDIDCEDNKRPYADHLQVSDGYYCTGIAAGVATFKWVYNDENCDNEKMYQLQISTNGNFDTEDIIINKIVSTSSIKCGGQNQVPIYVLLASQGNITSGCAPDCNHINYGSPYYWRVRVWDLTNKDSEWVEYANSVSIPKNTYTYSYEHPAPIVIYNVSDNATPGIPVQFTDISQCYNNSGFVYACSNTNSATGTHNGYTWTFGDNSATNNSVGFTTHTYVSQKTFTSSLKVCDEVGCCTGWKNVEVSADKAGELPQWKEISPF